MLIETSGSRATETFEARASELPRPPEDEAAESGIQAAEGGGWEVQDAHPDKCSRNPGESNAETLEGSSIAPEGAGGLERKIDDLEAEFLDLFRQGGMQEKELREPLDRERDIGNLVVDKEKPIVLYCQGGFRSALAGESIKKMGYKNVLSMSGGFSDWVNNNYPVGKP